MTDHNPSKTAALDESLRLLCELHLLTLQGQDESEAADAIRDAMEAPWWRLDATRQQVVRGLSADLYHDSAIRPAHKSHLLEYVRLLVDLHRLVVAGKGDGAEAEQVRDEMDIHWRELSETELAVVDGLAADLYRLDHDVNRATEATPGNVDS